MNTPPYASFAALVAAKAATMPDDPLLTFVSVEADGSLAHERRSYRALADNAQALARALHARGVGPSSVFAIMMQNHPEFVEAMLSAAILGACFVPIDPRSMGDKLDYMLRFAECQGVICTGECQAQILKTAAGQALSWLVVLKPGYRGPTVLDYAAALAQPGDPLPLAQWAPEAAMFMMFTSGTTGHPKAVVQAQGRYMATADSMRALGIKPDDILYTGLSLTHINAQGTLRTSLALGAKAVISRKFTKSRLWEICRAYGCTVFNLLGGMIPEVYSLPERPDDADNPVRLIISAGMPAHLWIAYQRRFGVEICEVYGATEGMGSLSNTPGTGPAGSIGKPPAALEAMAMREDGTPCQPYERGELCFRPRQGQAAAVRYFKNSEAGREKLRDGWLRTGDIVHVDDAGWFYFDYRKGGGVRRNGNFVNTALVESVLVQSGLVADIFVYGVATARDVAGEKTLVAAVVPMAGTDPDRLRAYCQANLEKGDVPDIFQLLAAIPKTISEKPVERLCIELLRKTGMPGLGASTK